jgi:hypothetical protein
MSNADDHKAYEEWPCERNIAFQDIYEGVSKSIRTGRLERQLQMEQLSATRCSCIAMLWVSIVSFAAITLYVASERVFIVVSVYFVIDSIRKLLNTPSYTDVRVELYAEILGLKYKILLFTCNTNKKVA